MANIPGPTDRPAETARRRIARIQHAIFPIDWLGLALFGLAFAGLVALAILGNIQANDIKRNSDRNAQLMNRVVAAIEQDVAISNANRSSIADIKSAVESDINELARIFGAASEKHEDRRKEHDQILKAIESLRVEIKALHTIAKDAR